METTQQTTTRTDHNIWPGLTCRDPKAIRAWLADLGFEEGILVEEDDGFVQHSEMIWPGGGRVMVHSETQDDPTFSRTIGSGITYVVAAEPDAVFARAQRLGATLTRPLEDAGYGSRGFSIVDPEGNSWSFGTYAG